MLSPEYVMHVWARKIRNHQLRSFVMHYPWQNKTSFNMVLLTVYEGIQGSHNTRIAGRMWAGNQYIMQKCDKIKHLITKLKLSDA
jgi:hypothetical protein